MCYIYIYMLPRLATRGRRWRRKPKDPPSPKGPRNGRTFRREDEPRDRKKEVKNTMTTKDLLKVLKRERCLRAHEGPRQNSTTRNGVSYDKIPRHWSSAGRPRRGPIESPIGEGTARCSDAAGPLFAHGQAQQCRKRQRANKKKYVASQPFTSCFVGSRKFRHILTIFAEFSTYLVIKLEVATWIAEYV